MLITKFIANSIKFEKKTEKIKNIKKQKAKNKTDSIKTKYTIQVVYKSTIKINHCLMSPYWLMS